MTAFRPCRTVCLCCASMSASQIAKRDVVKSTIDGRTVYPHGYPPNNPHGPHVGYPAGTRTWAPRGPRGQKHAGPCGIRVFRDITGPVRDPCQCVDWGIFIKLTAFVQLGIEINVLNLVVKRWNFKATGDLRVDAYIDRRVASIRFMVDLKLYETGNRQKGKMRNETAA